MFATDAGDLQTVQDMLENGADVNLADDVRSQDVVHTYVVVESAVVVAVSVVVAVVIVVVVVVVVPLFEVDHTPNNGVYSLRIDCRTIPPH
jgi:hypothetical protein